MVNRQARRAHQHLIDKGMREPWQGWEWATEAQIDRAPVRPNGLIKSCKNNLYVVQFFSQYAEGIGEIEHLIIRRNDGSAICPWRDKQRIKNEVLSDGRDRLAIEVFPPEADLINDCNCYHLWVYPLGYKLPFGYFRK